MKTCALVVLVVVYPNPNPKPEQSFIFLLLTTLLAVAEDEVERCALLFVLISRGQARVLKSRGTASVLPTTALYALTAMVHRLHLRLVLASLR